MRFYLVEHIKTALNEDESDAVNLQDMQDAIDATKKKFDELRKRLKDISDEIKVNKLEKVKAAPLDMTAGSLAESLAEICEITERAVQEKVRILKPWNDFKAGFEKKKEDSDQEYLENRIQNAKKFVDSIKENKLDYTAETFKEKINLAEKCVKAAGALYGYITKNSSIKDTSLAKIVDDLRDLAIDIRDELKDSSECFDITGIENLVKEEFDSLKNELVQKSSQKRASEDEAELQKLSGDDIDVAEVRRILSKHIKNPVGLNSILATILKSISIDGTSTDKNFILKFVLSADSPVYQIGNDGLMNLYKYQKSENSQIGRLDTKTIGENTTPWLYDPGFYKGLQSYAEFRNAMQAFELMRHPDRVKAFFGTDTKDGKEVNRNGVVVDEKLLLKNGKALPLNQINQTINKLREDGRVTVDAQAKMVAQKQDKTKGMISNSSVDDEDDDRGYKLSDNQLNSAKKYAAAIKRNKETIDKLPDDLKAAIKAAKDIFDKNS